MTQAGCCHGQDDNVEGKARQPEAWSPWVKDEAVALPFGLACEVEADRSETARLGYQLQEVFICESALAEAHHPEDLCKAGHEGKVL